MGHRGQELALGAVSCLSRLFGLEQFYFHVLALSNVAAVDNQAPHCRIIKQIVT